LAVAYLRVVCKVDCSLDFFLDDVLFNSLLLMIIEVILQFSTKRVLESGYLTLENLVLRLEEHILFRCWVYQSDNLVLNLESYLTSDWVNRLRIDFALLWQRHNPDLVNWFVQVLWYSHLVACVNLK